MVKKIYMVVGLIGFTVLVNMMGMYLYRETGTSREKSKEFYEKNIRPHCPKTEEEAKSYTIQIQSVAYLDQETFIKIKIKDNYFVSRFQMKKKWAPYGDEGKNYHNSNPLPTFVFENVTRFDGNKWLNYKESKLFGYNGIITYFYPETNSIRALKVKGSKVLLGTYDGNKFLEDEKYQNYTLYTDYLAACPPIPCVNPQITFIYFQKDHFIYISGHWILNFSTHIPKIDYFLGINQIDEPIRDCLIDDARPVYYGHFLIFYYKFIF